VLGHLVRGIYLIDFGSIGALGDDAVGLVKRSG
jgi:hypothetical protein